MTRQIIEAHKGKILLKSQLGQDCLFTVRLPQLPNKKLSHNKSMTDGDRQNQILLPTRPKSFSVADWLTSWINRRPLSPEVLSPLVALALGISTGLVIVLFRYGIAFWQNLSFGRLLGSMSVWGGWTVLLIPTIGGLVVGIIAWLFPSLAGQDFHALIGNTRPQKIVLWRPLMKLLAASISLGTGASLGPESPSVEVGANLGTILAQLFRVSKERYRLLLGAGAAAGLAAGFNAPIAGVFFTVEVVLTTAFTTPAASVILLSAFISATLASSILGDHPALELPTYQVVSHWEWLFYLGLGLFASIVALIFTQSIKFAQNCFQGKVRGLSWLNQLPLWLKPALGGLLLGVVALKFPRVLGVDYATVEQILAGGQFTFSLLWWLLGIKLIVTAISLASGLVGGIFAPALFLGACSGALYGNLLGWLVPPELAIAPPPAYAIVGMAAVLAATVKAPLTAIALMFELTQNYSIILPLMAAVGISVWVLNLISARQDLTALNLQQIGMDLEKQDDVDLLERLSVAQMMSSDYLALASDLSLEEATAQILARQCHTAAILEGEELVGIVSLADLRRGLVKLNSLSESAIVPSVGEICTAEIVCAFPEESLSVVLERMGTRGLYLLPVVAPDNPRRILGVIDREKIAIAADLSAVQTMFDRYRQRALDSA